MKRSASAFLALALLLILAPPSFGQAARPMQTGAASIRLRIGVITDGIVRVTPADLAAAGIDVATVAPNTFALSALDQPVAIRVTGAADGRFDPGDELQFFGERFRGPEMDQKYTDERVYWLEIGGAAGPRIPDVDAAPAGDLIPPTDFPTTRRAEQNNLWWTLHCISCIDTQDTWFWDRLQPLGAGRGITRTFPYTIPDPAPGFTATLRLEELSRADVPGHITTIGLGGIYLGAVTWDNKARRVFTVGVPAGLLAHGVNTVTVGALNQTAPAAGADLWPMIGADFAPKTALLGQTNDDIYVNYWEVDYRRLFRARDGQLDFMVESAGAQEYLSQGWEANTVAVWDVSDPRQPTRLTGADVQPQAGGFTLRFRATPAQGGRFWLQEAARLAPPASLRLRPPTDLRVPAGGADAVIVTVSTLRPAAEQLATWHRAHGRRVLIADFLDICDEFNAGIYHPKALPAMLAWAQTQWPAPGPRYLTLIGDGHWNFKGYNPGQYQPVPISIPPYLAWTDPVQGEVPSDTLYGDINGDSLPEIAVGRISANTLAEALASVEKITAYDENLRLEPWQRRAIFVADRYDPEAGDFAAVSDEILRDHTPADLTAQRIYLGQTVTDTAHATAAIAAAINRGAWMLQYTGHGAPQLWSREAIWRTTDVVSLTNTLQPLVVMTFNCLDGYFALPPNPQLADPALDALAEVMQRWPSGGSVAAFSPSGLGFTADQVVFRKILLDILFKENVRELGDALTQAKRRYKAQGGADYLISTMMLYGDPALRLPQTAWQIYLPVSLGIHLN